MTSDQRSLLPLRLVDITTVASLPVPTQKIKTEEDVEVWRLTRGYGDYALFLRRLNESVVGSFLPWSSPASYPVSFYNLLMHAPLLIMGTGNRVDPRSLGHLEPVDRRDTASANASAFWQSRLPHMGQASGGCEFSKSSDCPVSRCDNLQECETLLASLLPSEFHSAVPHLSPYLLTSFGSFTRMDYGTGHETSFALFLLCLTLIRFFDPEPAVEREIVLTVFVRYIRLCWRLQDVYKLEPAGSHGVWGLDDYSFLGYIFGSAQLRGGWPSLLSQPGFEFSGAMCAHLSLYRSE